MFFNRLLFALVVALGAAAVTAPQPDVRRRYTKTQLRRQSNFQAYVNSERALSQTGVLLNIGGLNSPWVVGATPGLVVASPSKVNPDYFYSWTRDSALTYQMLVDQYIFGTTNLSTSIRAYVNSSAQIQALTNPSGTLYPAGLGLGEPKFNVNETRFNAVWGRPQNDGPALRATAMMMYGNYLLSQNSTNAQYVDNVLWPIILNDLKFVGQYWNTTGYDLWEEVHGTSFFTLNAQHRALVMGSYMARNLSRTCYACGQASKLQCLLASSFWNATGGYLSTDINVNNANRTFLGVNPIISSIQVFDINADCTASDYQPCNSRMLATHKKVVDSFRTLYPINMNATAPNAVLIGRYTEDTYYGGNPWPLCTFACAELLYDATAQFVRIGSLTIDNTSLSFFQDIYPQARVQTYTGDQMSDILAAMTTYADDFIRVAQPYIASNGSISEQFNKTTGEQTSASKLTWSMAAFITMAQRRAGQYPASWGANRSLANAASNGTVNGTCPSGGYNSTGTYMPATAAGAQNVSMNCSTHVIFTANITTMFGVNAYLVGNTSLLGGSLNNASAVILPCNPGNYTSLRAEWYIDIYLPANITVAYQWVLQQMNGTYTFENVTRTVKTPVCGNSTIQYTNDAPGFPS